MAIVYDISGNKTQSAVGLRQRLINDPHYSPAVALGLMVFVMIYAPCMAVQAVTKKELGSWKWNVFSISYTLVLAWILAVIVYHGARLLGLG